jgi:hypothetical protein
MLNTPSNRRLQKSILNATQKNLDHAKQSHQYPYITEFDPREVIAHMENMVEGSGTAAPPQPESDSDVEEVAMKPKRTKKGGDLMDSIGSILGLGKGPVKKGRGRPKKASCEFEPKIGAGTSGGGILDSIGSILGFGAKKARGRPKKAPCEMEGMGTSGGVAMYQKKGKGTSGGAFGFGKKKGGVAISSSEMKMKPQIPGSMMAGMGKKKGAKKSWQETLSETKKKHPELKGLKEVIKYVKDHNLY